MDGVCVLVLFNPASDSQNEDGFFSKDIETHSNSFYKRLKIQVNLYDSRFWNQMIDTMTNGHPL